MTTAKRVFPGVLIFGLSMAATLVLVEFLLSSFYPVSYLRPPDDVTGDVWRQLIHRKSPVSGLAYELAPNQRQHVRGSEVSINSYGMRDDEPQQTEASGIRRIVVLGDSFTFGLGVPADSTYPNLLESALNRSATTDRVEVLNLGVAGYSTKDEAEALVRRGLRWKPELVIVGYVLNDPEIEPIQPLQRYFQNAKWWQHWNVFRLAAKARRTWRLRRYGDGDYYRYLHAPGQRSWESVAEAFDRIRDVTIENGIPVLLLVFPSVEPESWSAYPYEDLHRQVSNAAARRGFSVIDIRDAFQPYDADELTVAPGDRHPSSSAHLIVACEIYNWLAVSLARFAFSLDETTACP